MAGDVVGRTGRPGAATSWKLLTRAPSEVLDEVLGLLAVHGTCGTWVRPADREGIASGSSSEPGEICPEVESYVDSWFEGPSVPAGLREGLAALGVAIVAWQEQEDRDWLEEYRRTAVPVRIGRFVLDPREPGAERPAAGVDDDRGVRRLALPARSAFGTGSHETTRLIVEELQDGERPGRGLGRCRVLDIGTGTGVLSLVASSLGAGWVVGFDRDPEAPLLASQNAVLNGVRVPFFVGTVDALADDSSFELVLVNVLPENLAGQEETIAGRVAPGGVLLLSGVLAERSAEISDRWRAFGLELRRVRSCGDWVMLALERPLAGVEARRRSAARGAQW